MRATSARRCYAGRARPLIAGDTIMSSRCPSALAVMLGLVWSCSVWPQAPAPASAAASVPDAKLRTLPTEMRTWKGDFDGMLERRHIRVLVPFSRTLFYNDKGRERGITAETARAFEQYLNKKYASQLGKRPITLYLLPTTRDELLEDVANGLGDIAAGNLTVTDARKQLVDFVAPPDAKPNREIVLSGPKSVPVATAEALSGKVVHVRWTSSYHDSLVALNERLAKDGKPPVKLVPVPDELEDEDMMEMLGVGLLEYIVVDDWKARMWAQALPKITLNEGAVVREGGLVGWAMRKDSPKLAAELNDFYTNHLKKLGVANYLRQQHSKRIKALRDSGAGEDAKRFQEMLVLFQKYGLKYGFDPLMLAAQGYQESQLNQQAKSHVGAIGVMQIMPATGAELKVGDIRVTEANIHGGAKYMDQLMTRYFKDANFDSANRALFAFASYNAGPGNISKMRMEAAKRGLNPDKWFNNVEMVTAEKIGIETTTYVRNIFKYYTSYKLTLEAKQERDKARGEVTRK
jgi:membrane-bound lytic murein transglycosylase MltF